MINIEDYIIFKNNIKTLKELSADDSDPHNIQYMTESSISAVNFDSVKTKYANDLDLSEETMTSVDALVCTQDNMAFIEFKNGSMKKEKRKVKDKIRDSLLLFCDVTKKNISETRQKLDFVLVYNLEKNPLPNQLTKAMTQESASRIKIGNYFSHKGGQEFVLFDLKRFEKLYFRKVHTYAQEEFEQYLCTINKNI